ncbi:MAG TPA: hypothetical protein VNY84_13090 [Acidimicrobiales bacterium]|nr:hypothetical protein [Acidimicrobiales bacterium]
MTLYLHEVHRVMGAKEDEFEAAYRDPGEWMDRLAGSDEARLLWYLDHAHGAGPSYQVVTITAVADGAAWERLARRVQSGDLADWAARTDALRHDTTGKLLLPVDWSPLQDLDLNSIPGTPQDHEPTLYMEDTGWPDAPLDAYVDFWGRDYYPLLARQPEATRLLEIQACFQVAHGTHRRREAILFQRVHSHDRLLDLLITEVPPERRAPGTYMAEALTYRDQWESKLLRTTRWSPKY